jgi:minor extracellular serine protease Vpr
VVELKSRPQFFLRFGVSGGHEASRSWYGGITATRLVSIPLSTRSLGRDTVRRDLSKRLGTGEEYTVTQPHESWRGYRTGLVLLTVVAAFAAIATSASGVLANHALSHEALDIADAKAHVTQVWNTIWDKHGRSVRGQSILMGIVDSGIDYRNPDFKNPNGTTRIKFIWDQTSKGTPPPGFSYGHVCTSASVNDGSCTERDVEGHGTHVAGIAVGNGRSSNPARYLGVANMAAIGIVKLRGTAEMDIVDACRYLIQQAQQLHEPIVINLSLGSERGPHDGGDPEGQALGKLTGPGRIIVAAAGNESLRAGHASGTVQNGETVHIRFTAHDVTNGTLHLYYPAADSMTARLIDETTGQQFAPGTGQNGATYTSENGTYGVATRQFRYDTKWQTVTILMAAVRSPVNGPFDLTLDGQRFTQTGRFNIWSGGDHIRFREPDRSITLSSPADVRNIISVANYTTNLSYQDVNGQTIAFCQLADCPAQEQRVGSLDPSSSLGPTADGRQKPDLAAPGGLILSSRSEDVPTCRSAARASCVPPQILVNGGRNVVLLGTSMASPMVAGTVALMLQVRPVLTAQKARQILRGTARHDGFTGKAAWTAQWGAGKLDALAAVRRTKSLG